MCVQPFGLKEKLVLELVGKLHDLVFDGWTISWSDGLNLPAVHRRAVHVLANDSVRFLGGEGDIARYLAVVMRDALGPETEGRGIVVAGLLLKARPVDSAAIEAGRRAGFESAIAQAELLQSFSEKHGCRFTRAPGSVL